MWSPSQGTILLDQSRELAINRLGHMRPSFLRSGLLTVAALVAGFGLGYLVFSSESLPRVTDRILHRVQLGAEDAGHAGQWGLAQDADDPLLHDAEYRQELERLSSLGYAGGTVTGRSGHGVTVHDPERASDGLRFFLSGHEAGAQLIDPRGRTWYRWTLSYEDCVAGSGDERDLFKPDNRQVTACWRRARLLPDGSVLAIFEGHGLARIDRDSKLMWGYPGACHHDLDIAPDGTIHVLTREQHYIEHLNRDKPILVDYVTRLTPDGQELGRINLLEALENSVYAPYMQYRKESGDIFHTNTLEILDGRAADRLGPAFAAGNYLISMRELGLIAVVDPGKAQIVWAMSGMWKAQHQPTLLDGGTIMVFDNQGQGGRSKVIEIDPLTQEVVWTYADGPGHSLFSKTCGSNQRLPGGNTMITESDNGRALEVTPEGRVVWEFRNPQRAGNEDEYIAAIMEMVVLPEGYTDGWLAGPGSVKSR